MQSDEVFGFAMMAITGIAGAMLFIYSARFMVTL